MAKCCGAGCIQVGLGVADVCWCALFGTGIIQSPFAARWPSRIGFALYFIVMSSFLTNVMRLALKMAVQLASHAWPMENRGTCTFGIRWHTFDFAVGRLKGRCPFDVPCMRSELAVVIWIPLGVTISSVSGVC